MLDGVETVTKYVNDVIIEGRSFSVDGGERRLLSVEQRCPTSKASSLTVEAWQWDLGPALPIWFSNASEGDYHLTTSYPFAISEAAIWQTGDPSTDIDGGLRPTRDGSTDFAGADLRP